MFDLIKKRRRILLDEEDIILMLRVIRDATRNAKSYVLQSYEIGNCGWAEEPSMWFMFFDLNDKYWRSIIKMLKKENREFILRNDGQFCLTKRREA